MKFDYTNIYNMLGMNLDHLVERIPRKPGRYHIIFSRQVLIQAKKFFEYDKYRNPPHPHFVAYGKTNFDIDYIGHYLLPDIKTWVFETYDDNNLHLQYEIKR